MGHRLRRCWLSSERHCSSCVTRPWTREVESIVLTLISPARYVPTGDSASCIAECSAFALSRSTSCFSTLMAVQSSAVMGVCMVRCRDCGGLFEDGVCAKVSVPTSHGESFPARPGDRNQCELPSRFTSRCPECDSSGVSYAPSVPA